MEQSDDAPPAQHAVVDEQTRDELGRLAARIEQAIRELAPILDRCYRIQRQIDAGVGGASGTGEVPHIHSGARHLSDLLYLLAAHVDAAAGENVEDIYDVAWLKAARAALGLDEFPMLEKRGPADD